MIRVSTISKFITLCQQDHELTRKSAPGNSTTTHQSLQSLQCAAHHQALSAYKNGLGINLDVLQWQEQQQLLAAQLQLSSAGFDYTILYLILLRGVGDLP